MIEDTLLGWLLQGDVSIQYQAYRDLLNINRPDLKERIAHQGWGAMFLSFRNENGHWGLGFYQPKWTSTHYTLLDLKNLNIDNHQKEIQSSICNILNEDIGNDGGINPSGTISKSDVCINGMFLNYASYFKANGGHLKSIVDFILSQQLPDGGFNCQYNRKGAMHSSLHSTLSVLEGILEYSRMGYSYRIKEMEEAAGASREFLLLHKLFQSHRTGAIIDKRMIMLSYPSRWRYDILRALDYFRDAGVGYDKRMDDAFEVLMKKRHPDLSWPVQLRHAGQVHFEMEVLGQPSRFNTLRALRVLKHFGIG